MQKVLLHACCAICAMYPVEKLISAGYLPTIYFFNPNIFPQAEYQRRLEELKKLCSKKNLELVVAEEEHEKWLDYIKDYEQEPERGLRCQKCFDYRLTKAAEFAHNNAFGLLTTTLTVSPHKRSEMIFASLENACAKYDLKFLEYNFKKENGFLKTNQLADAEGFYRQTYCGCEFSKRD